MDEVGVQRRWVWPIGILSFCHLVAIASAQIVNILVDPIKASLAISDVQFSLLQGLAVALFASLLGIPVASLADRYNRKMIIVVGVAGWTLATASCGIVGSFGQLFAARVMVGIGEVFLFPAAIALILDIVPRQSLARAMALFGCGGPIGGALALAGGGWLLGHRTWIDQQPLTLLHGVEPWRVAFFACALLGIVALLLLATLREPARTGRLPADDMSVTGVFTYLARHWRLYAGVMGGMLALTTAVFATAAWVPTLLMRDHGFSPDQAGSFTGLAALVFAVAGTLAAGVGTDLIDRPERADGVIRFSMAVAAILLLVAAALPFMQGATTVLVAICALFLVQGMPTVLAGTAIQQVAPPNLRARLVAVYVLLVGLTAAMIGPSSVAALHEHLFRGPGGLGLSLALTDGIAALVAIGALASTLRRFRAARAAVGTR